MKLQVKFGARIKELRKYKGYTQEQFAEMIDISARSLRKIEMGECFPSTSTLEKLVKVLDIDIVDAFTFEHLSSEKDLRESIITMIDNNPTKIKEIYKIVKAIVL